MSVQPVDYKSVINDLEIKQKLMNERFDAAIVAIRQVVAFETQPDLPGIPSPEPQVQISNTGGDRTYKGMVIVDAAKAYLRLAGEPVANPELARALERGGFEHKSKYFPNTLNSVLRRRSMNVGDVKKSRGKWILVGGARGDAIRET